MEFINLEVDPTTFALVTFLCVGSVKLIESAFARKLESVAKILVSTLVGLAFAYGVDGLTMLTGAAIGLNASGLLTALSFFGKEKQPVDVPLVEIKG